jgi:hypothetical protein
MNKTYIGIDPGKTGGLAIIPTCPPECDPDVQSWEMPLGVDKDLDVDMIYRIINGWNNPICIIEKSQAMPKQGVKGVFNYGVGYGKLIAILELSDIPYQEVQPQKWKKEFSLINKKGASKKDKRHSVRMAEKLFPEVKGQFKTKRGRLKDGMAEALLMAEYGRRKNL